MNGQASHIFSRAKTFHSQSYFFFLTISKPTVLLFEIQPWGLQSILNRDVLFMGLRTSLLFMYKHMIPKIQHVGIERWGTPLLSLILCFVTYWSSFHIKIKLAYLVYLSYSLHALVNAHLSSRVSSLMRPKKMLLTKRLHKKDFYFLSKVLSNAFVFIKHYLNSSSVSRLKNNQKTLSCSLKQWFERV